ncbi:MAG TPA: DOMON-like domain-containing protein [Allosphingosinicella sp.]
METRLLSHPAHASAVVDGDISVRVERLSRTAVRFRYLLHGRIDRIVVPGPAAPARTDELWKTTCFEAFLAPDETGSYVELNFSPSSQWAAYEFTGYRAGMSPAGVSAPPAIAVEREADRFSLTATIALHLPHGRYRLGLAAIIEERDGGKSYFALAHPAEAPDFHRRDCFALELPAAERP